MILTGDPLERLVLLGLVALIGSFLQSIVGFGFGLLSIPLSLWIGLSLPQSVIFISLGSFVQTLLGSWHLRTSIPWRPTLSAVTVRALFIPMGIYLLAQMDRLPIAQARQVAGGLILVLVISRILLQPKPKENLHWSWALLSFPLSGLLAGTIGVGGPPLVLWGISHQWPADQIKAFLLTTFTITLPIQIFFLFLKFPDEFVTIAFPSLALIPLIYIGTRSGLFLSRTISNQRLRFFVHLVLILVCTTLILRPLFS